MPGALVAGTQEVRKCMNERRPNGAADEIYLLNLVSSSNGSYKSLASSTKWMAWRSERVWLPFGKSILTGGGWLIVDTVTKGRDIARLATRLGRPRLQAVDWICYRYATWCSLRAVWSRTRRRPLLAKRKYYNSSGQCALPRVSSVLGHVAW